MDLEALSHNRSPSLPIDFLKCRNCGCSCSLVASSSTGSASWLRSGKRKFNEFEDGNRFLVPEFNPFSNPRVQIENECAALRETVSSQQQAIQDLNAELEEERNASSSAANEAMSMILRLQREKAEIQMESRQFKRFAEEKMAHDQQELSALEDVLYKREQAIQSLTCEVQAYKHRMLSYGLTEDEIEGDRSGFSYNPSMGENLDASQFEFPLYDYPPLKCNLNENPIALEAEGEDDVVDVEKYAFGETPHGRDHLKNLEYRINQMENGPSSSQLDGESPSVKHILEKVIIGHSPRRPRHHRVFSGDSSNSFMGTPREAGPDIASESPRFRFNNSFTKMDHVTQPNDYSNLRRVNNASDFGDEMSDRVYTIDSVHNAVPCNGVTESRSEVEISEGYISTPRDILSRPHDHDPEIKMLYMRLHALEADRESLRQAIISMRTDKAQMVLLKEIAQHLCREMPPERQMPVKKFSIIGTFSLMSIFKWIVSLIFWRRKAHRSRYMCGLSATNVGLLLLLDKGTRTRQWRCLTSTRV